MNPSRKPGRLISRREALAAGAALLASPFAFAQDRSDADASPAGPGWIDAHSHIWTRDTGRFPLREGVAVDQLDPPSFTDDELMAIAKPAGVSRVVLIQHYPYHGWDNSYLLDACRRHPQCFRIVGMIDHQLPSPGRRMRELLRLGVTGFRIGSGSGQPDWLASDGISAMWKTAAETRQPMCCLINPGDLPMVASMCERHPDTPVVIDHFARIGMTGKIEENDLANLCVLKRFRHVFVKLSAFYALGNKRPPHDELIPMVRRLFEAFGPNRLMWASDMPYQLRGENSYESSIGLVRDRIDFFSPDDRRRVLKDTAESVFFFA